MFRAININNNESVISLNMITREDVICIKDKCKNKLILCPFCKENVLFRLCTTKRSHFSHNPQSKCPYKHESHDILGIRALLYKWLTDKFANKSEWKIDIELDLGIKSYKKKIDCLLHNHKTSIAYVILDKAIDSDLRHYLHTDLKAKYDSIIYIFSSEYFKQSPDNPSWFFLTQTHREFIHKSNYDFAEDNSRPILGSLFFISPASNKLKLIRRIQLIHQPKVFKGDITDLDINEALISPKTGEFVLPGEHQEFLNFQSKQSEHKVNSYSNPVHSKVNDLHKIPPNEPSQYISENPVGTCIYCNKKTSDWWSYDGTNQKCKCKECYFKGFY